MYALFIFILLDMIYFYFISKSMNSMVLSIQKSPLTLRMPSAFIVYVLLTFLLYQIDKYKISYKDTFYIGCLVYGIFEFTNYAIFKQWSPFIVAVDTIWGGTLLLTTKYICDQIKKIK